VVPTVTYRLLSLLVLLAHDRRRVVHVAVTEHPTTAWTAQQLRNAFPYDACPSYLLHDHDAVFAGVGSTIASMQIQELVTAPRSPWQNAYVERFISPIRRECLDHMIVENATGLQAGGHRLRRVLHAVAEPNRPLADVIWGDLTSGGLVRNIPLDERRGSGWRREEANNRLRREVHRLHQQFIRVRDALRTELFTLRVATPPARAFGRATALQLHP
jgi:hypothetical protein